MKHTICFSVILLSVLLLISEKVQGQVYSSVNPEWIETLGICNERWFVPFDIDLTNKEEIYVVGDECIEKFDKFGSIIERLNRENILYKYLNFEEYLDVRYSVKIGQNYMYINEGFDTYDTYHFVSNYVTAKYGGHMKYGGFSIVAYESLKNQGSRWFIVPGTTFEEPLNFDVRGDILGLDIDSNDNIYIVGMYNNSLPDPLPPPHTIPEYHDYVQAYDNFMPVGTIIIGGDIDVFLASYTFDGLLRWTRRIVVPPSEFPRNWYARQSYIIQSSVRPALLTDKNGNTYLFGRFIDGTVFGEGQLKEVILPIDSNDSGVSLNASDLMHSVIVSYDTEGNLRWVRTPDTFGIIGEMVRPANMTVDNEGNFFIIWKYEDLNTDLLNTDPFKEIIYDPWHPRGAILAKHATDGSVLWVRSIGYSLEDPSTRIIPPYYDMHVTFNDMVTDDRGHVYIGGFFNDYYIEIDNVTLWNPKFYLGVGNGYLAHYNASGKLLWVGHAAGEGSQSIKSLAVSPTGDLYVAGYSAAPFQLGSETHQGGGFLAKYSASKITSSEPVLEIPATAALASNYPNPFTHATTIEYALPASGPVRLAVYDALGREVATLAEGVQHAGRHTAVFDGTSLPSGVYLYRLETATGVNTGLMTLRK